MIEAGVDEAGRGPIAGPVFAAAVILGKKHSIPYLNDSKKISEKKREIIAEDIKVNAASWSIGISTAKEVDDINILRESLLAMRRAIDGLDVRPELISVDGQFSPETDLKVRTIIKGDQSNENIMAASIIAKVYRDNYMKELDNSFPEYGFKQHKGYPTKMHLEALELYGLTLEHRLSFKPVRNINESNR